MSARKTPRKPPVRYTELEEEIEREIKKERYAAALALIRREAADREKQSKSRKAPSIRMRELEGLALARYGRIDEAQEILGVLYDGGHLGAETLGIYARTFMDRYDKTADESLLRRSRDLYAEGFALEPTNGYTGINAAAKSELLGERAAARKYAKAVGAIVAAKGAEKGYWDLAIEAEVHLILHEYDLAATAYRDAVGSAPDDTGSHASTWLQAKRLMNVMQTPTDDREKVRAAFQHLTDADPGQSVTDPAVRRLRVFAFDPSASRRTQTAGINEVTLRIPWESGDGTLRPGPVGEYLEVVDFDPASGCFYEPIDLNDPNLLATDGLAPSEGNPQFHQQMVYGVAMNVIDHFERALGRRALWSSRRDHTVSTETTDPVFVPRLRVYPHALREANAYYSPERKALLFGYFPAEVDDPLVMPGGMVFTCLSHDVIAHEMSHALLDGLHPHFAEPSNPDVLAFHEAFADLVALFLHFSHADVLEHEIGRTRGDLTDENLLGQLAQEFGRSIGRYGSLRDAIGEIDPATKKWRPKAPDRDALSTTWEPHARGAILVAAVFDAFLTIYRARTEDLLRIATQGSGVLAPGALHPDLVSRLAREAAKSAEHVLAICIRALDYCPPIDIRFGDYVRAMITADVDSMHDDTLRYRTAFIEAFQRRGIYPDDVRTLSEQSLVWRPPRGASGVDLSLLFNPRRSEGDRSRRGLEPEWQPTRDRTRLWQKMQRNAGFVRDWFEDYCSPPVAEEIGLSIAADGPRGLVRDDKGRPRVDVQSVRLARRSTPDGAIVTDVLIELLQVRRGYHDPEVQQRVDAKGPRTKREEQGDFLFRGGCTLLVDPSTYQVRYAVNKHVLSQPRLERQRAYLAGDSTSLRATYFGDPTRDPGAREPFGLLHRPLEGGEA